MDAIVLCAGYATRLRPLTLNTPKPLLDVGDKPILGHILDKLVGSDVKRVFIVSNARFADNFSEWVGTVSFPGLELNVVDDGTTTNADRLGSMGDVRFVSREARLSDDFIMINGDNLFTFSLAPLLAAFKARGNMLALYDVGTLDLAKLYGIPTLDDDMRVTGFIEKPSKPTSTLASIGIYVYGAEVHRLLGEYLEEGNSPDKTGEFVEWLHAKTDVYGHAYSGEEAVWFDIGTIEQLDEARTKWGQIGA
ncbi:MAG: nucleotidyltransferase family protein [Phycisphaerae bacterium]|nr:nucleotidyltransferase family protein [Phycisphaerae bacterium]